MGDIYQTINLRNNNGQLIWSINGPFSRSLALGLFAGGTTCLHDAADYSHEYFEIPGIGPEDENLKLFQRGVPMDELSRTYNTELPYSIWIHNGEHHYNNLCDLYGFDTILQLREFLQGILTMCHAFHVEHDNVIVGCPIVEIDKRYSYLAIEGFVLPLLPKSRGGEFVYPIDFKNNIYPADKDDNLITVAAQGGHLHILQWLRENNFDWDQNTVAAATRNTNPDILEWMRNNADDPDVIEYNDRDDNEEEHYNDDDGWG